MEARIGIALQVNAFSERRMIFEVSAGVMAGWQGASPLLVRVLLGAMANCRCICEVAEEALLFKVPEFLGGLIVYFLMSPAATGVSGDVKGLFLANVSGKPFGFLIVGVGCYRLI